MLTLQDIQVFEFDDKDPKHFADAQLLYRLTMKDIKI